LRRARHLVSVAETAPGFPELYPTAQSSTRLVSKVFQEERVHRALQADMQVRDVAFGKRDDVDAGEGETLKEPGRVLLVAAESIERFGQDNVESSVQRLAHQRLETRAKQRGTGDSMIGELLHDRPTLASCELPAYTELVRDRCVALVVRRVSGVDGGLQCSVTSEGVARSAATSRSNCSRAAWRARTRTRTRSRSSRQSCAMLRGAACRACR
jgi:hypothetical protein